MSIVLDLNHPTFLLKKKIQEITEDFQKKQGFNYFQYLRCYADGSIGLLTNKTDLIEYFRNLDNTPVVYSSFSQKNAVQSSYWFLWDDALASQPVTIAREKFGIYHGITLVRRAPTYYDMIAVALPAHQPQVGSFYLNKLRLIENFINYFDKNNKSYIQLMDKNPISLPCTARDVNYEKICLSSGKIKVRETYITAQELACLRLLSTGFSYKEIGWQLNISMRTVETYIQRIKIRTGCINRRELLQLLQTCQ
jgi:DNA-binding CsgD family transcriptional regulator